MGTLEAVNLLLTLTQTLETLVPQIAQVSSIVQKAQSENRATLTDDEMQTCKAIDDSKRQALVAAISKALAA